MPKLAQLRAPGGGEVGELHKTIDISMSIDVCLELWDCWVSSSLHALLVSCVHLVHEHLSKHAARTSLILPQLPSLGPTHSGIPDYENVATKKVS